MSNPPPLSIYTEGLRVSEKEGLPKSQAKQFIVFSYSSPAYDKDFLALERQEHPTLKVCSKPSIQTRQSETEIKTKLLDWKHKKMNSLILKFNANLKAQNCK